MLLNNLISFNSDEIDAAKTRLDTYDKDIAATKQLLDSSRDSIELKKRQAALLKQERADALLKLDSAKELLNSENRILKAKQNAFEKIKVEERQESDELKKQQKMLQSMIDEYGPRLKLLKEEISKEQEIIKNLTTKKRIVGEIDNFLGPQSEYYGKTKALIMDIAKGGATAWLAVIKASLERWIELDKAALEFRKQTGFLVNQTKELDKAAREVNVQMANLGVNIEEAYAAAGALTEEFQVIGLVTKEAIANTAMVSANLGIGVAESAKIKGMFESIAESTGTTGDGLIKSAASYDGSSSISISTSSNITFPVSWITYSQQTTTTILVGSKDIGNTNVTGIFNEGTLSKDFTDEIALHPHLIWRNNTGHTIKITYIDLVVFSGGSKDGGTNDYTFDLVKCISDESALAQNTWTSQSSTISVLRSTNVNFKNHRPLPGSLDLSSNPITIVNGEWFGIRTLTHPFHHGYGLGGTITAYIA